jgi:hypothetical protein
MMSPMIDFTVQLIKQDLSRRPGLPTNYKRLSQIDKRKRPNLKPQNISDLSLNSLGSVKKEDRRLVLIDFLTEGSKVNI